MKNVFIVLFILCIQLSFAQEIKKLTLDDYSNYEVVDNPQMSPDGKQIIYTRQWIDMLNDKRPNDLWIMDADGNKNRYFMEGSSAKWSPDGQRLVFLKEGKPKGTQIFIKYIGVEGEPTQISRLESAPSNIQWSPDGKYISFTMFVEEKEGWNVKLPKKPKGATWTEEPRFVDKVQYRRDRSGFVEQGNIHLFLIPTSGGKATQITNGKWDHGGSYDWTPDSKNIIFSSLRIEESEYALRESQLYSISVVSKNITQLTARKGTESSPRVSPDGKSIAFIGGEPLETFYTNSQVYLMNTDGSNVRVVSSTLDRVPNSLFWSSDNKSVYFTAEDEGTVQLFNSTMTGATKSLTKGTHLLNISEVHPSGTVIGVMSSVSVPSDIVKFSVTSPNNIQQLTSVNEDLLENVKLGKLEEIRYKSDDGLEIQGWVVFPPDFDPSKQYPLILQIHGGPHAMYNTAFNFTRQLHATEGYITLYTNPRGSTGYGYKFANAIQNAYPGMDYNDLMRAVDAVIGKGNVDTNRLYVYGGSGGGVLTSWIIGQTDRFAAAGVLFPVINWLSFVGTTDGTGWYRNFKKYPWEDPSEHLARSPLMHIGKVKTPTLLMTGVKDLRTPMAQTEEYYQALKVMKVPAVMIRFNDEYHGTSSNPSNFLRTNAYLHYWFDKYKSK